MARQMGGGIKRYLLTFFDRGVICLRSMWPLVLRLSSGALAGIDAISLLYLLP